MLIDDNALVRTGTYALLRSWGCEAIAADSLQDARRQLAARGVRPEALIVDYRLRDGLGTNVIRALRADYNDALPAAIMTGDIGPDMLANTANDRLRCIHKPVRPEDLRKLVATLLSPRSQNPDLAAGQ